jgi:hypothetical protein
MEEGFHFKNSGLKKIALIIRAVLFFRREIMGLDCWKSDDLS